MKEHIKKLSPNIAVLYAAIGALLAVMLNYSPTITALSDIGFLPIGIVSLLTLYISSTLLGAKLKLKASISNNIIFLSAGIKVALLTLFITTLVTCSTNVIYGAHYKAYKDYQQRIQTWQEYNFSTEKLQPEDAEYDFDDYFFKPITFVMIFGFIPATILGLIYGFHARYLYRKKE